MANQGGSYEMRDGERVLVSGPIPAKEKPETKKNNPAKIAPLADLSKPQRPSSKANKQTPEAVKENDNAVQG